MTDIEEREKSSETRDCSRLEDFLFFSFFCFAPYDLEPELVPYDIDFVIKVLIFFEYGFEFSA